MKKIKWVHWSWLALTLLFLFFRTQNIRGVFTPDGVIVNDTDPYYRFHRIDMMLNQHQFYPLHEAQLNYPDGIDISWPLGLDLLISTPLKLYNSTTPLEIESFASIIIPFLSLPLLWFSGWVGNYFGGPLIGLLLGFLITCSSTLIYQTSLGRLDHHFLEATFPIVLLMFALKYIQSRPKFAFWGIVLLLAAAPSFAPQGWVIGVFLGLGFLWLAKWEYAHEVSLMFFYSFLLSLIPLSFSERFFTGYFSWISFSWWTPFVYLFGAVIFHLAHIFFRNDGAAPKQYKIALSFCALSTCSFLIYKNNLMFFFHNVGNAIQTVTVKTGTMASTLEARSALQIPYYTWTHSDMCVIIIAIVCFVFLSFKRKYAFLIGYTLIPILLSFFQIRFGTMALPLMFLLFLIFFRDWLEKFLIKQRSRNLSIVFICGLLIIPFRPFLGLTEIENSHYYFRPIRAFSFFLNNEYSTRNLEKKNQAILAHWDYGHWLLYYTGLPVIADPFQGTSSYEVLELFTSKGTDELKPFLERHPAQYLVIESGAKRSYNWLQTVNKDTSIYFDKTEKAGQDFFKTTSDFENLFMYRFFFELGRGSNNNHPQDWRLIYISPYSSPGEDDLSALKVFEHVKGVTIHARTKKNYGHLYIQGEVAERGDPLIFQQTVEGTYDYTWTVPYGYYDRGGVYFNGLYQIKDQNGKLLFKVPQIAEEQVLEGDRLEVRF